MVEKIPLHVNGKSFTVTVDDADTPLLYALRDELNLNNPHFGCGLAQCGACMVLVNGVPTPSCVLPISRIRDSKITTLEGLGTPEKPHPVQQAFIDEQAFFCGYCLNGWVLTATALVKKHPRATDAQIRAAFAGLKGRCGSHLSILRAVKRLTEVA